ncbi:MAG TPA: phenol hydroxylase [Comamonadaceae bacterium]|nr:phenol hydroxylase [Comamonadaceae bacterium]
MRETSMTSDATPALPIADTSLRYVRVLAHLPEGLVSFEFSIGWPELAVELLLPPQAFEEFCRVNRVRRLDT